MKYLILVIILSLFLIIGCEKTPSEPDIIDGDVECVMDDDCIKGGCSGTVCQSKDAPPVFTTCEYLPEYGCYKEINCGCSGGKCEWGKTEEFNGCVKEARESGIEVVG